MSDISTRDVRVRVCPSAHCLRCEEQTREAPVGSAHDVKEQVSLRIAVPDTVTVTCSVGSCSVAVPGMVVWPRSRLLLEFRTPRSAVHDCSDPSA